jgi:hypothetical protein
VRANGHFGPHVHENAHYAQPQVAVLPGTGVVLAGGGVIVGHVRDNGQVDAAQNEAGEQEHAPNDEVGQLHGAHVDSGRRSGVAELRQVA